MVLRDEMLREDALEAITDKRRGLEKQHGEVRAFIQNEMKRLRSIERELEDCDAASRVFGQHEAAEDTDEVTAAGQPKITSPRELGGALSPLTPTVPSLKPSFKEAAIEFLQKIYPRGLKATHIRALAQSHYGITAHEKTAGMTLYRLKKEGLVRRNGFYWYSMAPERHHTEDIDARAPAAPDS
ncbi:MAG: hypothetical protein E2O94_07665 [Alphaproteobacteria bacterium]|nr:MAG: hypothetical protein E2O94_07665 [Alphaproteobacteria bacterium]